MKVAVYDTHVTKKNGGTMYFDIIVSEEMPREKVLEFGRLISSESARKGNR